MTPESGRLDAEEHVIVTDLTNELILLDPVNQEMYALNASGRLVWYGLPAESLTDLQDRIGPRLPTDLATANEDIRRLIADLVGAGLVRNS
jgi:hypothetical protein